MKYDAVKYGKARLLTKLWLLTGATLDHAMFLGPASPARSATACHSTSGTRHAMPAASRSDRLVFDSDDVRERSPARRGPPHLLLPRPIHPSLCSVLGPVQCPALRVCILCASDTLPCLYFTRRLSWPASSEVPSPRLGDEEIISKKRETINNPAIAAPMIIYAPCFNCVSLRICLHVRFHAGIPSSHTSHRAKPVIPFAWWLSASLSHAQASAPVPADRH